MQFLRQEYLNVLPFPSPDLPYPGTEPTSSALARESFTTEPPGKPNSPVLHHTQIFIFFRASGQIAQPGIFGGWGWIGQVRRYRRSSQWEDTRGPALAALKAALCSVVHLLTTDGLRPSEREWCLQNTTGRTVGKWLYERAVLINGKEFMCVCVCKDREGQKPR